MVDRGRLVREAIAILLADLDARGKDSVVARRVQGSLGPVDGSIDGAGNGRVGKDLADDADDTASPLPS